jgi:hypothetical protein
VVGIFIGLQVNAWNESRHERVMEGHYLERILDDMDSSIDTQLQLFELEKTGIGSMDELARNLADGTLNEEDRDSTVQALNYMGWVENPKTRLVTTSVLFSSNYQLMLQSAFLEPSDKQAWGYVSHPDYQYMLSIPGFEKVVSNYSGWFKFHRTLLQAHHRDTIALHDLVQLELETRFR